MEDRWWEPHEDAEAEAKANTPWWAQLEEGDQQCPYCEGSTICPKCTDGCYECGFEKRCRLCNGKGTIPKH